MPPLQAALPAAHYVDGSHWRRERERVLCREWFCVGRAHELGLDATGTVAVVDVVGESLLLARSADGRLLAHFNVCRHRGSQVVPRGEGDKPCIAPAQALRCPYHSWTYDLDGRLLRAPHTDGVEGFDPALFGLHPAGVDEWAGFVFVHLTPTEATPLVDVLGDVPQRVVRYPIRRLRSGWHADYDVRANYKVVCENYNECYHCAGVHPELTRLVPAFGRGGGGIDWAAGVPHREGAWTFTTTGTSGRAPFPDLNDAERVRHKGEILYPNLLVSLSADHVAVFTLWPVDVDQTRIECDLLFDPDEMARDGFDPSDAAELWDLVNKQDWAICESVQRGMSSRAYTQGWYAPMEDESLDIRRWLLPRLETDAS